MRDSYPSFGMATPPGRNAIPANAAIELLQNGTPAAGGLLAYGNGRSYGDSCQNSGGRLADMRGRARILSFDAGSGLLQAEAGVLLRDIIALAAPSGFFPAVVPGTQLVTLGGAIANDIHGKNHHRRGTFGSHVHSFTLMRSDGTILECGPRKNEDYFRATIGGMGLTGLVLGATIRLLKVGSADVDERISPFSTLDEYFDRAVEADAENEYAVAWIDQLSGGRKAGRGLLMTANHARHGGGFSLARKPRLGVPFQPPFNMLNSVSIRLFNAAYRWAKGRRTGVNRAPYRGYFFPLDGVRGWNRLYGPGGLYQHQSVVPEAVARKAVPALLQAARDAGQASFLTVLKRFGEMASPGILSFPRPGYTLTLDFPNRGRATLDLLARLDAITVDAGGAVNPYKDARMGADVFAASFPDWEKLERFRDPAFMSDFWRRTAMRVGPASLRSAAE
ncbi:FAD-binding oxidoreductase [Nitratireductor luteus]|uniref:FAD-binding oxidoreductase n=1 Tax=Nitratireductor luteus TaxID=2976980 RepID=UPI00223F3E0C|nr:FAD-binding oxidoreductase [Nitratireductor luteus]